MSKSEKDETSNEPKSPGLGLGETDKQDPQQGKPPDPTQKKNQAINLYRFLQLKPQKSGITALLTSKYKGEAKTLEEWEATLKSLLSTKAK
ncbi:MAG: hypothetical protein LBH43_07100 [Treponema sp.]|jgi:hypothetical protein|nr:hypothetical protein [Treponema sp.]